MTPFRRRRDESKPAGGASEALPAAGTWAQVETAAGVIDVHVVDARRTGVTVSPARADDGALLDGTAEVVLAWTAPQGLRRVDAHCSHAGADTWDLELGGAPSTVQRRTYVRVPTHVHAQLRSDAVGVLRTTTADLSETGMRCAVDAGVEVDVGDSLAVSLLLDDQRIALTALVRRVVRHTSSTEVAMSFVEPYPEETIGRWLLAAQLRLRAAERADEQERRGADSA